jgi:hypothetical protein
LQYYYVLATSIAALAILIAALATSLGAMHSNVDLVVATRVDFHNVKDNQICQLKFAASNS